MASTTVEVSEASLSSTTAGVMAKAWETRKRFGGGMRQSGILAAACLHALEHHADGSRAHLKRRVGANASSSVEADRQRNLRLFLTPRDRAVHPREHGGFALPQRAREELERLRRP